METNKLSLGRPKLIFLEGEDWEIGRKGAKLYFYWF